MGRISEVYLSHIDPSICSPIEAGSYYYYQNTMGLGDTFVDKYEEFEINQSRIRRSEIGKAIDSGEITNVNMNTSMLAISALYDKVIVTVEI